MTDLIIWYILSTFFFLAVILLLLHAFNLLMAYNLRLRNVVLIQMTLIPHYSILIYTDMELIYSREAVYSVPSAW